MIKPDTWIRGFGEGGGISPFVPEHVNPASYDVTLGNHWIGFSTVLDGYRFDFFQGNLPKYKTVEEEVKADEYILHPGSVVLATTFEVVKLPRDVCADLKLKSTIGRSWINHGLAGWIDCGFEGQITLELQNIGPYSFTLTKGMKIAQLVFQQMESAPEKAYGESGVGRYQGQLGATRARG